MTRLGKLFVSFAIGFIGLFQPVYGLEGITDAAQIPAENFFKKNTEFSYRISPDGKQLAFIRKRTHTYNVVITDLDKFIEINEFAVSKGTPQDLTWISNSRLAFGFNGAIYAVNNDGADLHVLIKNLDDADKVNDFSSFFENFRFWSLLKRPSGNEEHVLFRSVNLKGYANIHKINVYTGEQTDLYDAQKLKASDLYADRDGKVILLTKTRKEQNSFYRIVNEDNDLELASLNITNQSYNLDYDAKSFLNQSVVVHELGYDKDTMYLSEKTSGDRYQLVKYNYVTHSKIVIGSDPIYDVGSPTEKVTFYYDNKNKKLVGFSYNADKPKTVWLDDRFKQFQKTLDNKYPGQINQIYDWNENADKLLVNSFDAKTNGKVIVFDSIKNKTIVQTDYSSILSAAHMKDTEVYKYKTSDGTSITSYLTPPATTTNPKWPLIVMPHGGPFSRSYYGYDGHVQYFSTRGYAVLQPNFRGSTGYGAQHLIAGKQQIADLMLADIADGVRELIKENKVDATQVYVLGFSYGGYAAIMSAIKYPELYSAAVSAAAPLDLNEQLKHYKKERLWFSYEFWQDVIGVKQQGKKFVESISPYYRAADIKIPLLIFHGEQDHIIPKEQVEKFKKLTEKKKLNIPVRIIQSEAHGWRLVSSNTYFAEKSVELFKANKKPITH